MASDEKKRKKKLAKKAKKRQKTEEKELVETTMPSAKAPENDEDDATDNDSDEDNELMAAAAAWAEQQEGGSEQQSKEEEEKNTKVSALPSQTESFSLHITQLPYDANELDIRQLFAEQGCIISSIRLVYDRDEKGHKTVFRGVAFVDFHDATSYANALKLNRSKIRGRKLNIRPTRSKQELADIVSKTKEMVQERIKKQKNGETANNNDDNEKVRLAKKQKKKDKKAKKKANRNKHETPKGRRDTNSPNSKDPNHKLTKKERNRKAAIILGMRRKKNK